MSAALLFGDFDNELLVVGNGEFLQCEHRAFRLFAVYHRHIVLGKANMVDGFYTGNSRNCGYSFGVYYSVFKGNANTWR